MNIGYPERISAIARDVLLAIKGDFATMLLGVIKDRPLTEKKLALQMALGSDKLTDDQKAQISELALDIGLHSGASTPPVRRRFATCVSWLPQPSPRDNGRTPHRS